MRGIIHIFILSVVLLQAIGGIDAAPVTATALSKLEEQRIVLVADGATPTAADFQSRTLDQRTPASPFDSILFNWVIVGQAADIQLRARYLQNGQWSDWNVLVHNTEYAPDNAPRNQYTSTLFDLNTTHEAWQIAVQVAPYSTSYLASIHAITMNNQGANPERAVLRSAAIPLPRGSKPPIVPRTTWGDATLASWDASAAPWSGYCNSTTNTHTWQPDPSEIAPATHVVVHHTAGTNYADPSTNNWPASVLGIWRYHAMSLGWCDIGYHYLIDPNGVIYEGRYTGVRDDGNVIDGAHALGYNRATIGISLMGNFQTVEPSAAAVLALDNLLSWIGSSKNIQFNTEQYYAYKSRMLNTIVGHRDVGSTSCPGDFLYAKLPEIRARAAQNTVVHTDEDWIQSVRASKTSIVAGDTVTLRMTIRNIYQTIPISGSAFSFTSSDAGFTYDQSQCWALKDGSGQARFPRPENITSEANNRVRIMAGIRNWDSKYANTVTSCPVASTIDHPWRWSIGSSSLAPGETRTVTGRVRFTQPGTYTIYFGIIKDWVGYPDSTCDRANNIGACQLNPITIRVIKPTATYPAYAETQVAVSTATHAIIQTQTALNKTQIAADRNRATREVLRGSPTRTRTRVGTRTPTPTPLPAVKSVIALRTATQDVRVARTATARIARTATIEAAQSTQTADDLTATAELVSRTPTNTATNTSTITKTRSPTNTATRTRTNQPTQTRTSTPIPDQLFDVSGVRSTPLAMELSQLHSDGNTVWAVKRANPPMLFAFDATTLAQQSSTTINGITATLLNINQHNPDELFIVGNYAWNLIAVQRYDIHTSTPALTGVWIYKTNGTPSALLSADRYVYLTINHAARGSTPAYAELITLDNQSLFTEAFIKRRLPGSVTAVANIDSGDSILLIAGENTNKSGYVVPVQVGRAINLTQSLRLSKPLQSLSTQIQTTGLIPSMQIIGSDGTTWTRLQYTIISRTLRRLTTQSNWALTPYVITSQPLQSVALMRNRYGFDLYSFVRNVYLYRARVNVRGLSEDQINTFTYAQNQLYWHNGNTLYRAVITLP